MASNDRKQAIEASRALVANRHEQSSDPALKRQAVASNRKQAIASSRRNQPSQASNRKQAIASSRRNRPLQSAVASKQSQAGNREQFRAAGIASWKDMGEDTAAESKTCRKSTSRHGERRIQAAGINGRRCSKTTPFGRPFWRRQYMCIVLGFALDLAFGSFLSNDFG
jgi:hypothetical protein